MPFVSESFVTALPTSRVVTGAIPATMFVYTGPLTHPNNQPPWACLIPAQSRWSQVELATGAIRDTQTPALDLRAWPFPSPLSPFVSSAPILNVTWIWVQETTHPEIRLDCYILLFNTFFHRRNPSLGVEISLLACKGMHIWDIIVMVLVFDG